MTAPAFLHRFCPDHDPDTALCGIDVAGAKLVDDPVAAAETMPACVVCLDLSEAPCEDACLTQSREVA